MGRLFWKLLLGFWLALISASLLVGVLVNSERDRARVEATQALLAANPAFLSDGVISPEERRQWRQMRRELRQEYGPPPPRAGRKSYWLWLTGLVASLAFSAVLAWYLAKPIRHLRQALQLVAHGQLDTRVQQAMNGRRDELADLGAAFDQMATQLQHHRDAQHRLLHDVSHELRSPLARLQVAIGIAQQNPEAGHQSLARIEIEAQRLDALIGELLTLSRLENASAMLNRCPIDVTELVASIVDDARFELSESASHIELLAPTAVVADVDEPLIGRAIENIVRNAMKFSPEGSRIMVSLAADANTLTLTVRDGGPGVTEADLAHLFTPFYRGAKATPAGHGLGLAIVERAVHAHGGTVQAENLTPHGLGVTLRLPLQAPLKV